MDAYTIMVYLLISEHPKHLRLDGKYIEHTLNSRWFFSWTREMLSGIAVDIIDAFLFLVYQLLDNLLWEIGNGISLRRKISIKIMQKDKQI